MTTPIRTASIVAIVACVTGIALWNLLNVPHELTADIAATTEVPPWTGALSTLGLVVWGATLGALVLTGLVTGKRGQRDSARFFAVTAGLAAYLAVDDALLVHEEIAPNDLSLPEPVIYMVFLLGALAWVVRYRTFVLASDRWLFCLAGAAFALSIVGDVLDFPMPVEDGAKYVGLLALAGWAMDAAFRAIDPGPQEQPTSPADEQRGGAPAVTRS